MLRNPFLTSAPTVDTALGPQRRERIVSAVGVSLAMLVVACVAVLMCMT